MKSTRLNLGCGTDIKKGYINCDSAKLPGVDMVWNLNKYPYPFKTGEFSEIFCKDVLEHLDDPVRSLKELHRIIKKGGKVILQVPHFSSNDNFADITHKKMFSSTSFDFFKKGNLREYYFDFHFTDVTSRITLRKGVVFFLNYLAEPIINISRNTRLYYETTCWHCLFPGFNIQVTLIR